MWSPFDKIGKLTSELTFYLWLVRVPVLFIIDGSGSVLYPHQVALDEETLMDDVYVNLNYSRHFRALGLFASDEIEDYFLNATWLRCKSYKVDGSYG